MSAIAVSYTHLDVYKRQQVLNNGNYFYIRESETVKGFIHATGIQSPGIASSPAIAEYVRDFLANAGLDLKDKSDYNPYREPVSYTHLDVYKRQALRWEMRSQK